MDVNERECSNSKCTFIRVYFLLNAFGDPSPCGPWGLNHGWARIYADECGWSGACPWLCAFV